MTWDMATVTPRSRPVALVRVVLVLCAGTVGLEFGFRFGFFLLILASFSKMGIDQNCSVYAWNWLERLWNRCWGAGDIDNQTDVLFPVLFLFSKTDKCDSGACPLPGGVTHGLPHLTTPIKPLCLALETPEFFVHLQPLLPAPL